MFILKRIMRIAFDLSPRPVRHFIRDRVSPDTVRFVQRSLSDRQIQRFQSEVLARKLEAKLWGGFSEQALTDLEALKKGPETAPRNVSYAAWALARWYWASGDSVRALENLLVMQEAEGRTRKDLAPILLLADCLIKGGENQRARDLLEEHRRLLGDNPHLVLAMANTFSDFDGLGYPKSDERRLEWINQLFVRAGLAPIEKADAARPLALDNLATSAMPAGHSGDAQPKISVIIPAFKAQDTLHIALESLLRQTWANLEILVVDDASPDGTADVANEYAARDSRIRVFRMEVNGGPYAARNAGLARASGEFVTTHDSDDWSHPQKLEVQARALLKDVEQVGNVTHWVRTLPHLFFRGTSRPSGQLIQWNHSSLMLRRRVLEKLGGWDEVRISADTELIRRLESAHGREVVRLLPDVPLSFALEEATSLTRRGVTHARTQFFGVRREYHESGLFWLQSLAPGALPAWQAPSGSRAFPAPGLILRDRVNATRVDLLVVMDFNLQGGAYISTRNYVEAALQSGLKVGLFHWRRYDLDVTKPLNGAIRQLAQAGRVSIIAPGESVSAKTVLVGYPVILQYAIDLPLDLDCEHFLIITNQFASRLRSGGDAQYDPAVVASNVERLFKVEPVWVPISGLVQDLMEADGRYNRIHSQTWEPLVDTDDWCNRPIRWRRPERNRPVIGRHARDHYTKWPASRERIAQAYCAGNSCDVRLLGGTAKAEELLGRRPANWRVHDFGTLEPKEFLADLDFFIHYPHEDYVEEFGRAVIEAMAMGIPVILPHVFEKTFADAAIYAAPEAVWDTVVSVWQDEQLYLERARLGREFVSAHCDWSQLPRRLSALRAPESLAANPMAVSTILSSPDPSRSHDVRTESP